jgi:hypothetical protein
MRRGRRLGDRRASLGNYLFRNLDTNTIDDKFAILPLLFNGFRKFAYGRTNKWHNSKKQRKLQSFHDR